MALSTRCSFSNDRASAQILEILHVKNKSVFRGGTLGTGFATRWITATKGTKSTKGTKKIFVPFVPLFG